MCEECGKKAPVLFKSPDRSKTSVCRACRDKYPDKNEWFLSDTCRMCGKGERYCECEAYTH